MCRSSVRCPSDLPGVNPATNDRMVLSYCLMTKVDRSEAIVRYFPVRVVTHGELANRLSSSRSSIKGRRYSSSRRAVPSWPPLPPPASSIFRVCSRPTDCPGTSTRTPCSPSRRLLSWPGRKFAGAGATAAAAALRRRTPTPAWSSAQPKFQTSAHRVVERPTATSCLWPTRQLAGASVPAAIAGRRHRTRSSVLPPPQLRPPMYP
jgi:hypothetical protein